MARRKSEIGSVGLPIFSGRLSLDPNRTLRGVNAIKVFREMSYDEPAATTFLYAANTLFRTDVGVDRAGNTEGDKKAAEHLEQCIGDMRDHISTYIRQMNSAVWAGWDVHEIVYKRRGGTLSRYDDGKVGWAHFGLRRQETLDRWGLDGAGQVSEFVQRPAPDYRVRTLPIGKCVHLVADDSEGSPEGRSALRGMHRQWYFVKNFELLMAIAYERFGTGLPVFKTEKGAPDLTPEQRTDLEDQAASVRQNEEAYLLLPSALDFEFAASPGLAAESYLAAIQRMRAWMLSTVLAEFIALGMGDQGGTQALGGSKIKLFLLALNGYQQKLVDALNRQAVVRLFRYNDFGKLTDLPQLTLPAIREYDLQSLGTFVKLLYDVGLLHPTPEDEAMFRKVGDMVNLDPTVLKEMFLKDEVNKEEMRTNLAGAVDTGTEETEADEGSGADDEDMPIEEE